MAFEPSVEQALETLRREVFNSGEFNFSEMKPSSIEQALQNSAEEGTRSILDISSVGETPDYCSVCPLPDAKLRELFGTAEPTHDMVEANSAFFDDIERGQGIYIVIYKHGSPAEYFFAGYSFD